MAIRQSNVHEKRDKNSCMEREPCRTADFIMAAQLLYHVLLRNWRGPFENLQAWVQNQKLEKWFCKIARAAVAPAVALPTPFPRLVD